MCEDAKRTTPPNQVPVVRKATVSDLENTVSVHVASFSGFFLTSLGRKFLFEVYRGFLESDSGIYLISALDGSQIGFVVGTMDPGGHFKQLLYRRWYRFILAGLPALLRHPIMVGRKFLGAVLYRGEKPAGIENSVLLSSLAVSPATNGKGVGRALVESFCKEAESRGASSVYLLTDRDDNEPVNQFYGKCGFRLESSFGRQSRRIMNRYVRIIAPRNNGHTTTGTSS